MDIKRVGLAIATAVVGLMLWSEWQHDYPVSQVPAASAVTPSNVSANTRSNGTSFVPAPSQSLAAAPQGHAANPATVSHATGKAVQVKTGTLDVNISLQGANLTGAKLPKYPVSIQQAHMPIAILANRADQYYVMQSGVTSAQSKHVPLFTTAQSHYTLAPDQKQLTVSFVAHEKNLVITKRYRFTRGSYLVHLQTSVKNTSGKTWSGSFYHQIARMKPQKTSHFSSMAFNGGAVHTADTPYKKLSYKDMDEQNFSQSVAHGWVAMQQHYFLSTWVPVGDQLNHYYSRVGELDGSSVYYLGFTSNLFMVKPGQTSTNTTRLYVGPEIASKLKSLAPGLGLTVDYGWLAPISMVIFWGMQYLHALVGNWGWTIILITLVIKILLYWPSAVSYRSMAKMKVLAPRMKLLQERHADDKQALSKATMEMYKKEKVNPMGGCLPMLVQIPIFIALYWVLIESVQLRQASFIFWIHDLATKDPFYVLPLLMGASMFLQQKLSPSPADPAQAKMMMLMPVVFTVFFLHFPAGLVLYWLTNNMVSIAQQFYVMKTFDSKAHDRKQRQKKKKKRY